MQENGTIFQKKAVLNLTLAALFSALAFLVSLIFHLPIIPAVNFLKYDPMDAVLTLEALVLGPVPAILSTLVVTVIRIPFGSSGLIGALMNFLSSASFVLPAGIIYRYKKTLNGALIGLGCSILSETAVMMLWNYLITPLYMGVAREVVVSLMLPGFLPFNFIKALANAVITFLLYKPLMSVLRKARLIPKSDSAPKNKTLPLIMNIIAVILLAAGIASLFIFKII